MAASMEPASLPDDQKRGRTLRLALAMRGGVSLAVWIGGAVAELDLFRRSCNAPGPQNAFKLYADEHQQHYRRGECYRGLLRATKYNKVEIDILAGASAGGLNAVLFALAQSCGVLMDDTVRRTWVHDGALWDLLQSPGWRRVPAVLQGDGVFFPLVREALRTLAQSASDPMQSASSVPVPPSRLTVELAATLLEDPLSPRRERRARFSFTKTPASLNSAYTTIPSNDADDASKIAIDRLALAARTTSSFPGAFEPAAIRSVHGAADGAEQGAPALVNMADAFIYGRDGGEPPEPFQVIDGGIYDNIPIDRAIQAIRRSPGTNPSERRLIYLDPEPPTAAAANTDTARSSAASLIPVVQRARNLQQRTENADDELGAIRMHNDAWQESRGRHAMLAAELRKPDSTTGFYSNQDLAKAYVRTRIAVDGERLAQLLTDPWSELCRPPFKAGDYSALAPEAALKLHEWLAEIYTDAAVLVDDVYGRIDQGRVLIGWIHALEDVAEDLGIRGQQLPDETRTVAQQLGQWKQKCYRCLTALVAVKQRTVDLVLAEPLRGLTPEAYTQQVFAQQMSSSLSAQTRLSISQGLTNLIESFEQDSESDFYEILSSTAAFKDRAAADDSEWKPCLPGLGSILDELKREIVDRSTAWFPAEDDGTDAAPGAPATWRRRWDLTVYSTFYTAQRSDTPLSELTELIAIVGGPISTPLVKFHRITGDEPPGALTDFAALIHGARAKQLEKWIRRLPQEVTRSAPDGSAEPSWPEMESALEAFNERPLTADAKLAGNVLNRFGGFFSARWRENDWQWGRLDAAAGIARMLSASERPDAMTTSAEVTETVRDLQSSILLESQLTLAPSDGLPIASAAGADTFDAISPRYMYSLVARTAPLLYRALLPSRGSAVSLRNIGLYLAQVPLRLLAVPLVLIADPLRLAWAMVIVLASASILGAGASTEGWQVVSSLILAMLAVWIYWRAHTAGRSLRTLISSLERIDASHPTWEVGQWRSTLVEANTDRWRKWSLLLAAVVMGTAVYELTAVAMSRGSATAPPVLDVATEAFLAGLFFVLLVQHFLNQRAYRVQAVPKRNRGRKPLAFAAGIAALGVIYIAEYIARQQDSQISAIQHANGIATLKEATGITPWWDRGPTTWVVAAAAVGLLTFLSLWGWTSPWRATLFIVAAATVGGVLQALVDHGGRFCDVMPTLVWVTAVALVHPAIAVRSGSQQYGETGRPELITTPGPQPNVDKSA